MQAFKEYFVFGLILLVIFIPCIVLGSGHYPVMICPDYYITGNAPVCPGGYITLSVVFRSYSSYSWSVSWSNGATGRSATYGPIYTNTSACVTVGGSPGGIWCSVTQCVTITVLVVPDERRDTSTCVNSTINLYWPFNSPWQYYYPYTFNTPGGPFPICRINNTPCTHNECWDVTVCPIPDFTIRGDTLVCPGQTTILRVAPTPQTIEAYGEGSVQWSTGSTSYSINVGPINRDTTFCARISGNCGGNWCTSEWKCINVHPLVISTITKDTVTCVDSAITLYWPIGSTSPIIEEEFTYSEPGTYEECQAYSHPCEYTECWRVQACPKPADFFTISTYDTLLNGEINYRVCLWSNTDPPQPRNNAIWRTGTIDTFNANCRIVRAPCHGDKQVCAIDTSICTGSLTCVAEFCTTVVGNYVCPCISDIIDSPAVATICPGNCKVLCLVSNPSYSRLNLVEWYGEGRMLGNDSCIVVCPESTTTYQVYGYVDLPQGCFGMKTIEVVAPTRTLRDTSICFGSSLTLSFNVEPGDSIFIIDSLTLDTLDFLKPINVRRVTTTITPSTPGTHRICKDLRRAGCHFIECADLMVHLPPTDNIIINPPLCPTDTVVQVCLDNPHRYIRWSNGSRLRCTNYYLSSVRAACGGLYGREPREIMVTFGDSYYDSTTCYTTLVDTISLPQVTFKIVPNHASARVRTSITLTPSIEPYFATDRINWYTCPRGSWSTASNYPDPVNTPYSIDATTKFCASFVGVDGVCSMEACTTIYYGNHILTVIKSPFSGDSLGFFAIYTERGRADSAKGVAYIDWVVDPFDVYVDTFYVMVSKYENSPDGYYVFSHWNNNPADSFPGKYTTCTAPYCTLRANYSGPFVSDFRVTATRGDTLIIPDIYPTDRIIIDEENYLSITNAGAVPLSVGFKWLSINISADTCRTMRLADNFAEYRSSSNDIIGLEALVSTNPSNFDLTPYRTWVGPTLRWSNLGLNPSTTLYTAFKIYTPKDYSICYRLMPRPLHARIAVLVYYRAGLP